MALLRLAQERYEDAGAAIRAALVAHAADELACVPLWVAQVEIAAATGGVDDAEAACGRLEEMAGRYRTSGFEAEALTARGAVELARGRAEAALPVLREACRRWRELSADYHAARVCVRLAEAYRSLGADDAARLELAAAAAVFGRLAGEQPSARPDGLTAREAEVLALVAAGRSNRDVAAALVISEKTVARHLANIFVKIGVGSRTEAAAYAFMHGIAHGAATQDA
jgi:DNA-binding CsgD family transcriptional regulator